MREGKYTATGWMGQTVAASTHTILLFTNLV